MATATAPPLNASSPPWTAYDTEGFYDEMFDEQGQARPRAELLLSRLRTLADGELILRQRAADLALLNMGITFNVYGHEAGTEKIWPFDIIPRIIEASEWSVIEAGLKQRITALNLFIDDMYHDQKIVRDGVFPEYMVQSSKCFLKRCVGPESAARHLVPHHGHRPGARQRRHGLRAGRQPALPVRRVVRAGKPRGDEADLPAGLRRPVDPARRRLSRAAAARCCSTSRRRRRASPTVVVLTPGIYNSAYFEHCFLAQQMGVELVQGSDLVVSDGYVHARTTRGLKRVDVIYRRIDDDFLDPLTFRPDSMLGVPGLMDVYRAGRVALANAPGTGVADDKAVYAYVPQIIKYYLGEDIKLPNVPTFICADDKQRQHVLANLDKLVIKPANESGGYGILLGPRASPEQLDKYRELIEQNPRNYVAQPMLALSRVPTVVGGHLEGRHVDLRPYILYGEDIYIVAGRTDARGAGQGFAGRQLVARRRQQGHLGAEERHARGSQ